MPFSFKKYQFWIFYPSKISQIWVQRPAISYLGGKNISLCFSYKILLVSSFSMRRCADKNNRWFFFYREKKKSVDDYLPTYFLGNRPKSILLPWKKNQPPFDLTNLDNRFSIMTNVLVSTFCLFCCLLRRAALCSAPWARRSLVGSCT